MDTLIVATPVDTGFYVEIRGARNTVRCVSAPITGHPEDMDQPTLIRTAKIFSCFKVDIATVVEEISKQHVGADIKVYDLTQQFTRIPGELKSLTITKDGKLPF